MSSLLVSTGIGVILQIIQWEQKGSEEKQVWGSVCTISNFYSQRFRFVFFPELTKTEILPVGYDVRFSPKINSSTAKNTITLFDNFSHCMFLGSSDTGSFSTLRQEKQ